VWRCCFADLPLAGSCGGADAQNCHWLIRRAVQWRCPASPPLFVRPFRLCLSSPSFAMTQSFIGRVPVSVRFDPGLPRCLVPKAVGLILGHSRVGQRFVEVLTAEYESRLLTTDVECEVVSLPDDVVVLGSNWLFAWREVWRSQLGSPSIPECRSASPAPSRRNLPTPPLNRRQAIHA
jgi:hypothetical protein